MTKVNYSHTGSYSDVNFQEGFIRAFSKDPRFRSNAIRPMCDLLHMIARDTHITDIRWTAYMLATTYWETTTLVRWEVPKTRHGKPLHDKHGKPIMVKRRAWLITMSPVTEVGHGRGRRYHEPVRVKKLKNGNVRITEQDGDQFQVTTGGTITKLTRHAKMGTTDGGKAAKAYDDDDGQEHAYYGRGYVQLTWWSNYAKAGVALNRGLSLLLDPELVKDPQVAYDLMSYGMRTGFGFANRHKFADYFSGTKRDYKGARHMVNGNSHAADIAAVAEKFEKILLDAVPSGGKVSSRLPLKR